MRKVTSGHENESEIGQSIDLGSLLMSQVRAGHEFESEAEIRRGKKCRLRENVSYLEMCPVDRLGESFAAIPSFHLLKEVGE